MLQYSLTGKDGSGSGFGSWKRVPTVPVPLSFSGKTVPTVPIFGSGSVPEPPCKCSCVDVHGGAQLYGGRLLVLALGAFLLTVELLCLQSDEVLIRCTFSL